MHDGAFSCSVGEKEPVNLRSLTSLMAGKLPTYLKETIIIIDCSQKNHQLDIMMQSFLSSYIAVTTEQA
jgi:hypothetical protein